MKGKYVLFGGIGFLVLIIVAVIIFESIYYNPQIAFERTFGFELPKSAVIVKYKHSMDIYGSNFLYYKIKLGENDYNTAKNNVGFEELLDYDEIPPGVQGVCRWWDLNNDDIVHAYRLGIWYHLMFTKDKEGQYFLYAFC